MLRDGLGSVNSLTLGLYIVEVRVLLSWSHCDVDRGWIINSRQ